MRIIFAVIFSILIFTTNAKAEDAKFYAKVLDLAQNEYLYQIDIQHLAEHSLYGLSKMDNKVRIANGATSASIYYNGKIAKTIVKPTNPNNKDDWADYIVKVTQAAMEASPEIKAKDFEVAEYILMSMFSSLDKDTRYYPYLEVGDKENTVKQRYFVDRIINDNTLYMKLGPLNLYTRDSILESLKKNEGKFNGIIIDLRGNPGGLLSEAVAIVKIFLDEGIIASSRARKDGVMKYYTADEGSISAVSDKTIVVLVDGETASSAEVLAASLKEQSVAKVVGTKTKGKGTVQKLIVLDNGGELVITTANFYTPSGRSVNDVGVKPNICMFDLNDNESVVNIIEDDKHTYRSCPSENRKDLNIDIDVASALID